MPALKGRHAWSKKPKSNPYAQRGLDQFALVSAELQAARDRLVAQLGTPLSLVRFTSGSDQTTWIPIIVASTSSKAEMRALRRAASDLVTGGRHNFNAGNFGHHTIPVSDSLLNHLGSSIGEYNTHKGFGISEKNMAHDSNTNLGSTISEVGIESSSVDTKSDVGHEMLGYFMVARQGFLWMVNNTAFGLRNIADLGSKAILSECHTDGETVGTLPSLIREDENVNIDHPCADMASSAHTSSQAQPISIARRDMKGRPLLHVEDPKIHTRSNNRRFPSTTQCSPRVCEQTKALSASVSLPRTAYVHGHTLHGDTKEKKQPQKSSTCKVDATASKISGQALSGAGLVLVLGGLVMGYIPAIFSVVCWWYVLPSMRKAVGDKPSVRSHHHHHASQEYKSNIHTSVNKHDMHYQEHKKKVIMDGLLERQQCHSKV